MRGCLGLLFLGLAAFSALGIIFGYVINAPTGLHGTSWMNRQLVESSLVMVFLGVLGLWLLKR